MFPVSSIPAVNVASVPQHSPLRYPGGKTWLIPHIRAWLEPMQPRPSLLVEQFCGGATVSLTAVFERLAERYLMVELDRDVAAFWHCAPGSSPARRATSSYAATIGKCSPWRTPRTGSGRRIP